MRYEGDFNANKLAREYAFRGHWFCTIWHEHGCRDGFLFNDEHSPPESEDFLEWALSFGVGHVCLDAAAAVRALRPDEVG